MIVLGLDTSTRVGGAAVVGPEGLLGEYTLNVEATHAERLLPAVNQLLKDTGLSRVEGVAVALGPGSYTGLRIGVTAAKVLAYAWRVPMVGVGTLDALAWQLSGNAGIVCPLLDARRGRVYGAIYRMSGGLEAPPRPLFGPVNVTGEELLDHIAALDGPVVFTGDGLRPLAHIIERRLGERWVRIPLGLEQLRSGSVASLGRLLLSQGEAVDPFQIQPEYLRKAEAELRWEKRQPPES